MLLPSSARVPVKFQQAQALHQRGEYARARALYEKILDLQPQHFGALHFLGVIAAQTNQPDRAVELMARSILINGKYALAHNNYGNALAKVGRHQAALESYDRAISLEANYADAHFNRGLALYNLQRYQEAIASYDKAIGQNTNSADAYFNRAIALSHLENNREAIASYDLAIRARAGYVEAYSNRGLLLKESGDLNGALYSYNQAIVINPQHAEAYSNRGLLYKDLQRWNEALADYDRAIAIRPDFVDAHNNRANALQECSQYEAAIESYDRAIAIDSGFPFLFGMRWYARMQICAWDHYASDLAEIAAGIERGQPVANPFCMLAASDSPALQKQAAEIWVRTKCRPNHGLPPIPNCRRHDKIRIGYFSYDFRDHPVSHLVVELIEAHDRACFEIIAFSYGPDTQDAVRTRVAAAFDRFIDVRCESDQDIVLLARKLEIDIAVDLGGFTQKCRPKIFAMRAAPLQVSYIGFLGTMGTDTIDYLIADAAIIAPADRAHYSEKILYLSNYQVNDSQRALAEDSWSREAFGLPATGFVFCCFNTSYKITPIVFDTWMRILAQVEGGVLFLYGEVEAVERNLRKECRRRGIDGARLIFGKRLPRAKYLARYRAADLFLDTLPYNAGTTASDALWAGLPVLTCSGGTFAGRVAASLLRAVGLPELIASDQTEYETLAVALARDPPRLARIKQRLAANRLSAPLFDTRRFARDLESGYTKIYERYRLGLPAEHTYSSDGPQSAPV